MMCLKELQEFLKLLNYKRKISRSTYREVERLLISD